ncbi:unnamed protein product [Caenorhabditis angaria]|uniref:Uncharacterized protein n=1 Tax=Caenorhabditis angaria TaxID=860376 RepID=A0A9P1I7W5_9PELO|nr:unnamed protein product [Caenorhabditis angaria]
MSKFVQFFAWLAIFQLFAHCYVPLRTFMSSQNDVIYPLGANLRLGDGNAYYQDENRSKRGFDMLKRRSEIIERNRCFFNPVSCY